ncbi:hypothetical protein C0992_010535 [Termitomyces sp. T32_za158]|nr:hypothetical protein C0992_010535 [Termitomyces sp. T32_za158]
MTSSLRNSIHRRNHKERSQLAHRTKLGILEKHADYVKRARDYHSKQDKLTRLFPQIVLKHLQKIDKLKNQLTEMADLMKPNFLDEQAENDLEEGELQILIDAGIISGRSRPGRKGKHIIFVEDEAEAHNYRPMQSSSSTSKQEAADIVEEEVNLGWKSTSTKKSQRSKNESFDEVQDEVSPGDKRRHLLKELAARLVRDQQLRYAQREFEMQRLMMGKGGRKKIAGAEKVEGDSDSEEDEDEVDARKGKPRRKTSKPNDETYKPRVYKWRLERKR